VVLCLVLSAPASAARSLLSEHALHTEAAPGGVIEGPCGIALSAGEEIYVSAYYAHAVEVFSGGFYKSSFAVGASPEGPCQLASAPSGALYANRWHEGVERVLPSKLLFDEGESTGVAVDASGNVYVDDRNRVEVYGPSGTLLRTLASDPNAEYYGLATFDGEIYLADAATDTVKVFEADGAPSTPIEEIDGFETPQGKFVSLIDATLAIDPSNGNLLVVDNLQPGYVHPKGAIEEFDASGAFLVQLPGNLIDGTPSGLAFSPVGTLYATSGNSEEGTVFSYGAATSPASPGGGGGAGSLTSAQAQEQGSPARQGASASASNAPPASASQTIQRGQLRVGVNASLAPKRLPRRGSAPISFSVAATISATKGSIPPQLQRIEIEINRNGQIEPRGLPSCEVDQIQPATNEAALETCAPSLVGTGTFKAKVLISQQAPFPSNGKVYAFNGTWKGRPAILAHVYGTKPVPTSSTIPFVIGNSGKGPYGTKLTASLPQVTSKWGYVTGISMKLGRSFSSHGKRRSYLSAGCPAPKGISIVPFPLSRTSLDFAGGKKVSSVLRQSCRVR
jgi:hypothetical protein